MYRRGYNKKFSKNMEFKKTYYKFALFESENIKNNKLILIREYFKEKGKEIQREHELEINADKINQRLFYDFIDHFIFNDDVKECFYKKSLNIFELPKKTVEHIGYRSNGLNIKKINEGNDKKIQNLRIWNDDLSFLKEQDLVSILTEKDFNVIVDGVYKITFNQKRREELVRNALRWCVRGLTAKKALLKIQTEYENRLYFVKKNAYKKRFKKSC